VNSEELRVESEDPLEEITFDTAMRWLDEARPQAALTLLRELTATQLASTAFAGFRPNASAYANPIVRLRLAQMLVRDAAFREHFRNLLPSEPQPQPLSPPEKGEQDEPTPNPSLKGRESLGATGTPTGEVAGILMPESKRTAALPHSGAESGESVSLKEQLDQERQLRKRDRSEARAGLDQSRESAAAVRRELDTVLGELRRTTQERDALSKALEQASERISRLDRRTSRLRIERDSLLKKQARATPYPSLEGRKSITHPSPLRGKETEQESTPTPTPSSDSAAPVADRRPPAFETAVRNLRANGDNNLALAVAEEVLRTQPRNVGALEIASAAYRDLGQREQSVAADRELILAALEQGEVRRATESLVTTLIARQDAALLDAVARPYVLGLRGASTGDLADMAKQFIRLRGTNPAAHGRVSRMIEEYAAPAIAAALFPSEQQIGPADPLPFDLPEPITATALLAAIDAGDTAIVDLARTSLARLMSAGGSQYDRVVAALSAAGGDETYLRPLVKLPRGPIVVDASNVAWHDESRGVADRPRLKPILQIRATLRMRGFFPVVLITDAPLPYTVDDREGLRKMIDRREVTIVDTGTDADEVLVREAKRLGAPIVSNDYMADWDPADEIEKIRFAISTGGTVYLLS